MLTGKQFGSALGTAMKLKGVGPTELARVFNVRPPSVHGWIADGRISRDKLEKLFAYFSDVVEASHWGLSGGSPMAPASGLGMSEPSGVYRVTKSARPASAVLEMRDLREDQARLLKLFKSVAGSLSERQVLLLRTLLMDLDHHNRELARLLAPRPASSVGHRAR